MAPEQITDPDAIDHRVDVYGAGAILYHMLGGAKPYGGLPINTLLHRILESPPPPLGEVPDAVRAVVEDAMERDRDRRSRR
jgi:serine/threonine-protein kinase